MQGVKPWQLAVIVIGLLVGGGLIAWQTVSSDEVELADTIIVVDAVSGEIFRSPLPSGRSFSFPMVNPATGKETILPVAEIEGKWFVSANFRGLLKGIEGASKGPIDSKTFEVVSAKEPIDKDLF